MDIVDHLLSGRIYRLTPNGGAPLSKPTLLVMHFTASGGDAKGDADFLSTPAAKASAHAVVGRDGSVLQIMPFNKKTWHAGKSVWRGVPNCNDYSIGIEIDNWGILDKRADGHFYSWTGVKIADNMVIEATNQRGVHGYWEAYPEAQLQAVIEIAAAIREKYPSITEIVGHEDIAPVRKVDPGPAFPMRRVKAVLDGRKNVAPVVRKVIATSLNLRSRADATATVLKKLALGTSVSVLNDAGAWSYVRVEPSGELGWVNDQWIR